MSSVHRYYLVRFAYVFAISLTKTTYVADLLARGITQAEVHLLYALFSVVVMALEAPTSLLGEAIGPARSFGVGALLKIAAAALFFLGNSFEDFAVAEVLSAIAVSLISGSLGAWIMARIDDPGRAKGDAARVFIVGERMSTIALALGGFAGAYASHLGRESLGLRLPWVGVAFGFLVTASLAFLVLDAGAGARKRAAAGALANFRAGIRAATTEPVLLLVLVQGFAMSFALASPRVSWVPYLHRAFGGDMQVVGRTWLAIAAMQFLGTFGLYRAVAAAGSVLRAKLAFSLLTGAFLLAVSGSSATPALFVAFYLAIEWTMPYHDSLALTLIHDSAGDRERLTVLNLQGLMEKLGRSAGLLLGAWLGGGPAGWTIGVAVYACVLPGFLLVGRSLPGRLESEPALR